MCGSLRPISLINVDNKLLSKLLAARLEKLLPSIINTDQTRFIQNRFSLLNIMGLGKHNTQNKQIIEDSLYL